MLRKKANRDSTWMPTGTKAKRAANFLSKGAPNNSDFLLWQAFAPAKPAYMPSMAINARKNRLVYKIPQDRPD